MSNHSPQQWFNLEERFFANMDQELLGKLREQISTDQSAEAILRVTGLNDKKLGEEIAALKITPETLSAFRLTPLVAVAWADDRVEENERYVITQAAEKSGMGADDPAMQMLKSWTERRPPNDLFEAWCDYAKALCSSLDEEHRKSLKAEVLREVHAVAEAAGGLLGFGSISPNERALIQQIEQALS